MTTSGLLLLDGYGLRLLLGEGHTVLHQFAGYLKVAAVWLETKMYILVLAIFGHFPAELGSRTVLNGFSLKNGAEFTQNHPRGPILRPFGGNFPV